MPEWESLLREKLGRLRVPPERADEIVAEIAGHLDDAWSEQAKTVTGATASSFLSAQVGSVERLRSNIKRAVNSGGVMSQRSKQFWMPALLGFVLTWFALGQNAAIGSPYLAMRGHYLRGMYFWPDYRNIAGCFLIAGLAALIARKCGASPRLAFLAGVFPLWRSALSDALTLIYGFKTGQPAFAPWPLFLVNELVVFACFLLGALLFSRLPVVKQPAQPGVIHA